MKKSFIFAIVCAGLLFAASGVRAAVDWKWKDGSSIALEYSEPSGGDDANASLLIVDFQNSHYYVFEYTWGSDETPTGWDMLQAVGEAGTSTTSPKLNYEFTDWGWGIMLDSFSYHGNSETAGGEEPWPSWVYYVSDNNIGYFSDPAMVGLAGRDLANGSWDGWSWHTDGWGTGDPPVPEPATLSVLALGTLALLLRRKT